MQTGSLISILSPVLYVCIACGLYNKFAENSQSSIFCKISKHAYNILFIGLHLGLFYVAYKDAEIHHSVFIKIELILKVFTSKLMGVIMVVYGYMGQRTLMKTLQMMETKDNELSKYSRNQEKRRIKQLVYAVLLLQLVLLVYRVVMSYLTICKHKHEMLACMEAYFIFEYYTSISHVHSIMFNAVTLIVRQQFRFINDALLNAYSESKPNRANIKIIVRLQIASERLLTLKKMHSHLIRDSEQINRIFSVPLLFKFIDRCFLIFYCIHALLQLKIARIYALPVGTLLFPVCELLSIVLTCQSASTESLRTGAILHKLRVPCRRQKHLMKIVCAC